MRELFFKLFGPSWFNTGISVEEFSLPHIIYVLLIAGAVVGAHFLMKKWPMEKKVKAMEILVWVLAITYLFDFFVHDFVYADYDDAGNLISAGGLNMDKLPFHICTVLCPLAAFAQFNKHGKKIIEPIVILAAIAPMMYLVFPGCGDGEPWCYRAFQTMFYHGVLLAWGMLNITLGVTKLDFKNSWKSACFLVGITLWAKFGVSILDYNWFFLKEDAFYIGLVEMGVIPQWLLMIINPVVFFLAVLAVYGVYHLVMSKQTKKADLVV